jgi:CheY-like chemotaxis protein
MTVPCQVLVVEDDLYSQQIITTILQSLGHRVTACGNGAEAVRLCTEARPPFDAVLMDLQMPVMDGLEATRRLRAAEYTRNLPIVCLSAKAGGADREAGLEAGCDHYLAKPFDYDTLVQALEATLACRRPPVAGA